jgi:hypothetical protein
MSVMERTGSPCNFLLFCQNTPRYPHLYWRSSRGVPGHDLLFHGLKEVQDENELMFGRSDSGELMVYFGNPGCFSAFLRKKEIGTFYGRFWERFPGNGGWFGLGLMVGEMQWCREGVFIAQEKGLSDSLFSRTNPDSIVFYVLLFNPRANARAAARSFSSGFPLLIPPKIIRGPTVSHPLQKNSSITRNPRLAKISFKAA